MDKRDAVNKAERYAALIKKNFHADHIFLFGSYHKGSFREESDIDIAVVLEDFDDLQDMQLKLMKLRREIDNRIEPHPFRRADFMPSNPLVTEILNNGQEIGL
jgi:predicted nucleotidyltransferase